MWFKTSCCSFCLFFHFCFQIHVFISVYSHNVTQNALCKVRDKGSDNDVSHFDILKKTRKINAIKAIQNSLWLLGHETFIWINLFFFSFSYYSFWWIALINHSTHTNTSLTDANYFTVQPLQKWPQAKNFIMQCNMFSLYKTMKLWILNVEFQWMSLRGSN